MEKNVTDGNGAAVMKQSFKEKIENFWYHYKWHSIVAVFLLFTLSICTLQMCQRTSYDIHITYAGYYEVKRTGAGGSSPYHEAVASLSKIAEDFDGDGKINVSLDTLFIVNEEEAKILLEGTTGKEIINEALVKEDKETLQTEIVYGDKYIFFLSESLFREYEETFDGKLFRKLGEYAKENSALRFASEEKTGVYLNSLEISGLPVLCDLPDDTVICMRELSEVSQIFGKAQNEENYRRGIEFIKNLFE